MRISCSRAQVISSCGKQYQYRYEDHLQSVALSFPLFFGRVVDDAVSGYVHAHALGHDFDILKSYEEAFDEQLPRNQIRYPQHWDADVARETGRILCDQFPDVWEQSNLVAVVDKHGAPIVQRRLIVPLPDGHELECVIDFVVMSTMSGDVAVLDLKTTSCPLTPESPFGPNALQLTAYQYAVDHMLSDYMGPVSNVGFMEAVRRKPPKTAKGQGPTVHSPLFFPRRTDAQIKDMISTFLWSIRDISGRRFHRPTNNAFNAPCDMCDFSRLCVHGDMQGITKRPQRRVS